MKLLNRTTLLAVGLLLILGQAGTRAAEDYDRIAPKAVPAPPVPSAIIPNHVDGKVANPNQVLIKQVKALVFVPTPAYG